MLKQLLELDYGSIDKVIKYAEFAPHMYFDSEYKRKVLRKIQKNS